MDEVPYSQNMGEFKTGAFVGKFEILPIVIKYKNYDVDPYCHYSKGENLPYVLFKKLLGTRCDVHIQVLPLQKPSKNMSIEGYRDKIRNLMSKEYTDGIDIVV
eukprot:768657-Hanusia_phi.AAC.14